MELYGTKAFHASCRELRSSSDQNSSSVEALEKLCDIIEECGKVDASSDDKTSEHLEPKGDICICKQNGKENCIIYFISYILKAEVQQNLHSLKHNKRNFNQKCKDGKENEIRLKVVEKLSKWLWSHHIDKVHIEAFQHCITSVHDDPGMRKQICEKVLNWIIKKGIVYNSYENTVFIRLQELLIAIATDVWSVIRSICVKKVGQIVKLLSPEQVQQLFEKFVYKTTAENQWQARDGSIMAIRVIIQQFRIQAVGLCSERICLQFGKTTMEALPDFIMSQMQVVVFRLLTDTQLAIREHAIQAYITFLHRCPQKVKDEAWKCLTGHLSKYPLSTTPDEHKEQHMNAYEAEGFLGVCDLVIKHISVELLLKDWKSHFATFSQYLRHPASTVRQAASKIFKHIVCQVNTATAVTKILLDLGKDWSVIFEEQRTSAEHVSSIHTWQYKEGRMLTYELILNHLLTNYYMYTLGQPSVDGEVHVQHVKMEVSDPQLRRVNTETTLEGSSHKNLRPESHPHPRQQGKKQKRRYSSYMGHPHQACGIGFLKPRLHSSDTDLKKLREGKGLRQKESHRTGAECLSLLVQVLSGSKHIPENLFIETLRVILYQTVQCIVDDQWELQRIGQQVLPIVTEVIQWSCTGLLNQVLSEHLNTEASSLNYASCLLLHHALHHSLQVEQLMASNLTKVSKIIKARLNKMVSSTKDLLADHVETLELLMGQAVCDKVSVYAMEIIMTSHIMSGKQKNPEQERAESTDIVQKWLQIYVNAHPDQSLSSDIRELVGSDVLEIPETNQISCLAQPTENASAKVQQAEKYMLTVLNEVLVSWLRETEASHSCRLLPILAAYMAIYQDHDLISRLVLIGLDALIQSTLTFLDMETSQGDEAAKVDREAATEMVILCLQALASNILHKDLSVSVMRHSIDRYTHLFLRCPSSSCFHQLITTAIDKYGNKLLPQDVRKADPQPKTRATNRKDGDEDEAAGSDWDSWDEDDDEDDIPQITKNVSTEVGILSDHLKHIQTQIGKDEFSTFLRSLSEAELQWLQDMLDR